MSCELDYLDGKGVSGTPATPGKNSSRRSRDVERVNARKRTPTTYTVFQILIILFMIFVTAGMAFLAYSHFTLKADCALRTNRATTHESAPAQSSALGDIMVNNDLDGSFQDSIKSQLEDLASKVKALQSLPCGSALKEINDTLHEIIRSDGRSGKQSRKPAPTTAGKVEEYRKTITTQPPKPPLPKLTLHDHTLTKMNQTLRRNILEVNESLNERLITLEAAMDAEVKKHQERIVNQMTEIDARITTAQKIQTDALKENAMELRLADGNYTRTLTKMVEGLEKALQHQNEDFVQKLESQQNQTNALNVQVQKLEEAETAYTEMFQRSENAVQQNNDNLVQKFELQQNQTKALDLKVRELEKEKSTQRDDFHDMVEELNQNWTNNLKVLEEQCNKKQLQHTLNVTEMIEKLERKSQGQRDAIIEDTKQLHQSSQNHTEMFQRLKNAVQQNNDELVRKFDLQQNQTKALDLKVHELEKDKSTQRDDFHDVVEELNHNWTNTLKVVEEQGKQKQLQHTLNVTGMIEKLKLKFQDHTLNVTGMIEKLEMRSQEQNSDFYHMIRQLQQNHTDALESELRELTQANALQIHSLNERISHVIRNQTDAWKTEVEKRHEADDNHTAELHSWTSLNLIKCSELETNLSVKINESVAESEQRLYQKMNESIAKSEERQKRLMNEKTSILKEEFERRTNITLLRISNMKDLQNATFTDFSSNVMALNKAISKNSKKLSRLLNLFTSLDSEY